jgi:hypothetical protein
MNTDGCTRVLDLWFVAGHLLPPATESGPPPDPLAHGLLEPSLVGSADEPRREAPSPRWIEVASDGRTTRPDFSSPPREPEPSPG